MDSEHFDPMQPIKASLDDLSHLSDEIEEGMRSPISTKTHEEIFAEMRTKLDKLFASSQNKTILTKELAINTETMTDDILGGYFDK